MLSKALAGEAMTAKIQIRNPLNACRRAIESGLYTVDEVCLVAKKK